jgi:hypothetical protein
MPNKLLKTNNRPVTLLSSWLHAHGIPCSRGAGAPEDLLVGAAEKQKVVHVTTGAKDPEPRLAEPPGLNLNGAVLCYGNQEQVLEEFWHLLAAVGVQEPLVPFWRGELFCDQERRWAQEETVRRQAQAELTAAHGLACLENRLVDLRRSSTRRGSKQERKLEERVSALALLSPQKVEPVPAYSKAIRGHNGDELVFFRRAYLERSPNLLPEQTRDYENVVGMAAKIYWKRNRLAMETLGYEFKEVLTYAWLWMTSYAANFEVEPRDGDENQKLAFSFLEQNFSRLWKFWHLGQYAKATGRRPGKAANGRTQLVPAGVGAQMDIWALGQAPISYCRRRGTRGGAGAFIVPPEARDIPEGLRLPADAAAGLELEERVSALMLLSPKEVAERTTCSPDGRPSLEERLSALMLVTSEDAPARLRGHDDVFTRLQAVAAAQVGTQEAVVRRLARVTLRHHVFECEVCQHRHVRIECSPQGRGTRTAAAGAHAPRP